MTTITANRNLGIVLGSPSYSNPIVVNPGVSVYQAAGYGGATAIYATSGSWTISNAGLISGLGTSGFGVSLRAGGQVSNAATGIIAGAIGVYIGGEAGTVANAGSIAGAGLLGAGISFSDGGYISNALSGTITSSNTAEGRGVYIVGAAGTVRNSGLISSNGISLSSAVALWTGGIVNNAATGRIVAAQRPGVYVKGGAETVDNQGSISSGSAAAISLIEGGDATNQSGGLITGAAGIAALGRTTVANFGTINGVGGNGVQLRAGGYVSNAAAGVISGAVGGVYVGTATGTVINAGGLICGTRFGIDAKVGGTVTNQSGGGIEANYAAAIGVYLAVAGTVINQSNARITATGGAAIGIFMPAGGTVTNQSGGSVYANGGGSDGLLFPVGGTVINQSTISAVGGAASGVGISGDGMVINQSGGTISGIGIGIDSFGAGAVTVVNAGTIIGGFEAVGFGSGQNGRLVVGPGAVFSGSVNGGNSIGATAVSTLELASGSSVGTISGFGSQYQNFGNVTIDDGARWSLGGTVAASTTVAFSPGGTGSLTLANSASMSGTIIGFGTGETLSLSGITNATGVSLSSGNVLTVTESSGPGLTLRFNPAQLFVGETFSESTSGGATNITVAGGVTQSMVSAAYDGILRIQPDTSLVSQTVAQSQAGQTTLAEFETGLVDSEQAVRSALPALVTIDAFYNATPSGALLTTVAAATTGTSYSTAAELHNLGYSDANVWTILGAGWGADPGSNFHALYNADATGTTAGYINFIDAAYQTEFGAQPTAANLQNLLADISGLTALLSGGGNTATPMQIMGGLYGYLLYAGQANFIGHYAAAADAFLRAAANGSVTYGPELTAEFPPSTAAATAPAPSNSMPTVTSSMRDVSSADANTIPVTGSDQLIDPGVGNHTIEFLMGTSGDTLMPHANGVDLVYGFDPATDALDLRSLLSGTGLDLTGDVSALGHYLTVVDQGADALLRFDPTGQGDGGTITDLAGLGSTVTGLNVLLADGAIRIT